MQLRRRTVLALLGLGLLLPRRAFAIERDAKGWYFTGSGVRVKRVGPFNVNVYAISHFMHDLPPVPSKASVIAIDTDKVFTWRLLRDLEAAQIQNALRDAFAMNGYADRAKIDAFLGGFARKLPENTNVSITYESAPKTTTVRIQGAVTATVPGIELMRATWSIWFGNIDQPSLGAALISKITAPS